MTPEQKWVIVACVVAIVLILNASAFVLFMFDKHCAEERLRRAPESTLLLVALVGGSAGGISCAQDLGTKMQEKPFPKMVFFISRVPSVLLSWMFVGPRGPASP